jgi:hypothetical protein
MMKILHKGYRIWAILQTNGKYRAYFVKPPVADDAEGNDALVIEGETQAEAIDSAREFLDGLLESSRTLK